MKNSRHATPARALTLLGAALLACACDRSDTTVVTSGPEAARERSSPPAPAPSSAPAAPRAAGGAGPAHESAAAGGGGAGGSAGGAAASAGASAGGAAARAPAAAAPGAVPSAPATLASAPPSSAAGSGEAFRHPLPGRLIAIGDVHGDLVATRTALRLGGAIDEANRWIGGDLRVVQTGDQLDRGDHEREILDLFEQLTASAASQGGAFIVLNGNHEVMNVQGDFRYVTPAGVSAFAGVRPRSALARAVAPPFTERAAAFLPGGAYAQQLARRDVIAVVGDSVFVHGGVLPEHVRYGIDRINREAREWMRAGDRGAPAALASEMAPVWVRDFSLDPVEPSACERLGQVLSALKARRMVVGHTVQSRGISSACDERVWRIDVGLSRYYGEQPIQVLEIQNGAVRVLSTPRPAAASSR